MITVMQFLKRKKWKWSVSLGVFSMFFVLLFSSESFAEEKRSPQRILNIIAHQDDDLLFQSPDLIDSIRSGDAVKTLYITAGDGSNGVAFMMQREAGVRAAYAWMANATNEWEPLISERRARWTLKAPGKSVELVSLRLPDGGCCNTVGAEGYAIHNYETIEKLWYNQMSTIHNITHTTTFTRGQLINTLLEEIRRFQPTVIRIQDMRITQGGHSDHVHGAIFAYTAQQQYEQEHGLEGFGYSVTAYDENVFGRDLQLKTNAFLAYAQHDPFACKTKEECNNEVMGYDFFDSTHFIP